MIEEENIWRVGFASMFVTCFAFFLESFASHVFQTQLN